MYWETHFPHIAQTDVGSLLTFHTFSHSIHIFSSLYYSSIPTSQCSKSGFPKPELERSYAHFPWKKRKEAQHIFYRIITIIFRGHGADHASQSERLRAFSVGFEERAFGSEAEAQALLPPPPPSTSHLFLHFLSCIHHSCSLQVKNQSRSSEEGTYPTIYFHYY